MSEHDELVKRLKKAAEDREFIPPKTVRAWITPRDAEEAAQAIERLERELANTQAAYKKACDIAAEVRAREGRLASHLCQALGQWQMYAEMQEDCDLSRDDTPEAELYRLAHNVLAHNVLVGREALAAPATHPFREVNPVIDKCGEYGWPPMKDAPRIDGHHILALYRPKWGTQRPFERRIVHWNDGVGKAGYTWPCWMCSVCTISLEDSSLHGFQELPAPPEDAE